MSLVESMLLSYSRFAPTERGGYRLARLARRTRPRERWTDDFATPDGFTLRLDLATYPDCCMAYGLYELATARLIRRILKPGDHFVDGGANIGYFTMLAAMRVGESGRIDAIEPEPDNRQRLIENIERNGFKHRIHVHDVALADAAGGAVIHRFDDAGNRANHGCSSMFAGGQQPLHSTPIQTAKLDDILLGYVPRLIKLDIEGSEPWAVAGAARTLQSPTPPAIIAEHNPESAASAGVDASLWIRKALEIQPRFQVHVIGATLRRIDPASPAMSKLRQTNLLLSVA
jgi:FkbM family methyltransferase